VNGGRGAPSADEGLPCRAAGLACLLFVRAFNAAQYRVAWVVVVVDSGAEMAEELARVVAVIADVDSLRRAEHVMNYARGREPKFVMAFAAVAAVALFVVESSRCHWFVSYFW